MDYDWKYSREGSLEGSPDKYLEIVSLMQNESGILRIIAQELELALQHHNNSSYKTSSVYYCCGPAPILNYIKKNNFTFYCDLISRLDLLGIDMSTSFINFNKASYPEFDWLNSDAVTFKSKKNYISILNSSYHHIPDSLKAKFLLNISNNMEDKGQIIMGENFLPKYGDAKSRTDSIEFYYSQLELFYLKFVKLLSYDEQKTLFQMIKLFREVKQHYIPKPKSTFTPSEN